MSWFLTGEGPRECWQSLDSVTEGQLWWAGCGKSRTGSECTSGRASGRRTWSATTGNGQVLCANFFFFSSGGLVLL